MIERLHLWEKKRSAIGSVALVCVMLTLAIMTIHPPEAWENVWITLLILGVGISAVALGAYAYCAGEHEDEEEDSEESCA